MSSEKKLIGLMILLMALIFAVVFIFIQPYFAEIKNLADRIEKEQNELEALYQRGKTLAQAKDELKEIENKKTLLDGVFLTVGKELDFITSLEKIAAKNNIIQEVVLKEKKTFQNDYDLIPITLALRGGFHDFIKYFRELEKLDFYLNINYLNANTSVGKDQLSVSLEAKTYWQKK